MESCDLTRPGPDPDASLVLEAFARELLALIRGVRVYPEGHPYLQGVADRVLDLVRRDLPGPLAIGVMPGELSVGPAFAGGKNTRAGQLAAHLHARKVLRLLWTRDATSSQAAVFARLLSHPTLRGEELKRALPAHGIVTIDLDVLDLARLHDTFQESSGGEATPAGDRGRVAWRWLLQDGVSTQEIAAALSSSAFWEPGGRDPGEATAQALVLVRLGERLKEALSSIPEDRRSDVERRLAELGGELQPQELAVMIQAADREGGLHGAGVSALTRGVTGERLVELLAALASLEGRNTRRLADVFRRFAPGQGASELLPVVRDRLESPGQSSFTAGVWRAVEDFLLDLREDPFMEAEYAASLETVASRPEGARETPEELDLLEDPEGHLDRVLMALAAEDREPWGPALLERIEERIQALPLPARLELLGTVHRAAPGLLRRREDLLGRTFREGAGGLRDLDRAGRDRLLAFAVEHEGALLDSTLRALGEEERISVRRFLVDVISAFSEAATPAIVARLRSAPWYVTRNLAIALGRRGEPRVVPALRSLLDHEHPKVRREAVVALGLLAVPAAREALLEVEEGRAGTRAERDLASRVLVGGG